jgi:hypothetical protein
MKSTMKSTNSSLLSVVAVLLATSVLAGAAPARALAADALKVKTCRDTVRSDLTGFTNGKFGVFVEENFAVTGSILLNDMKLSQVVTKKTRVRLVQAYSYEPAVDAQGTVVPVNFSLSECASLSSGFADLYHTVPFLGKVEAIRDCSLHFSQKGRDVAIEFRLAGHHLAYSAANADGSGLEEGAVGQFAIASCLLDKLTTPQSVLGQAVFTLEVRPGGGAKHVFSKRIHLVTKLEKAEDDTWTTCKIVGLPWSEK